MGTPSASTSRSAENASEVGTPIAGPSRKNSTRRRSAHATAEGSSSSATAGRAASTSTSSSAKAKTSTAVARRRKTQLHLRDDAMLVWFWIPVLLIAAVVLLFSKSSSIFSYADLMSYLDLPAVGRNREA
jgi:hypothetical protein